MKGSRTNTDFSKHIVEVIRHPNIVTYLFHTPGTSFYKMRFTNAYGILAVSGDCGNWIFCREFHPAAGQGVSDSYWIEKLKIASTQQPGRYDSDLTQAEIREWLDNKETELTDKEREYLEEGLRLADDELEYTHHAYRENCGRFADGESVPFCKKLNVQLQCVFDAFDEMCDRMKDVDTVVKKSFHTLKQRTVTDVVAFTGEQFIEMIQRERPKELYNDAWSSKRPFIVITEYNDDGLMMYCNAVSDKTPIQKSIVDLYKYMQFQGLAESYIRVGEITGQEPKTLFGK